MQEKQAEAAAAKGTAPPKAALEGDEGEDLDPNLYHERRVKAVKAAKDAGEHTYPHKFHVSISLPEFVQKYESIPEGDHVEDAEVSVAGRIYNKRASGTKLVFYDLQSDGVRIQVMADARYPSCCLFTFEFKMLPWVDPSLSESSSLRQPSLLVHVWVQQGNSLRATKLFGIMRSPNGVACRYLFLQYMPGFYRHPAPCSVHGVKRATVCKYCIYAVYAAC